MAGKTTESNGSRESKAKAGRPDLKWAVEWLVKAAGTAAGGGDAWREQEDGGPCPAERAADGQDEPRSPDTPGQSG